MLGNVAPTMLGVHGRPKTVWPGAGLTELLQRGGEPCALSLIVLPKVLVDRVEEVKDEHGEQVEQKQLRPVELQGPPEQSHPKSDRPSLDLVTDLVVLIDLLLDERIFQLSEVEKVVVGHNGLMLPH